MVGRAEKGQRFVQMSPEELEAAVREGMNQDDDDSSALAEALGVDAAVLNGKIATRLPHFPDRPYESLPKNAASVTICWHMHKDDVRADLPLASEHQIQYCATTAFGGKWITAAWDGDLEGTPVPMGKGKASKLSGRQWSTQINDLTPGYKFQVRVRCKNDVGWSKWSWNSKQIVMDSS